MSNKIDSLLQILSAAEQHLDYMKRSLASETGRYTVGEHDQLWGDILGMRDFISKTVKKGNPG